MKDAHEVGGVLWRHQSQVARQFHAIQHDMRTMITQLKPRCTCYEQPACETRILRDVPRLLSSLCLLETCTAQSDSDRGTYKPGLRHVCFVIGRGTSLLIFFCVGIITSSDADLFVLCVVSRFTHPCSQQRMKLETEASTKGALFCKQEGGTVLCGSRMESAVNPGRQRSCGTR